MTSAIGGVGGGSWAMQRPDTSSMVKNLFAKVDTKNQGYIDKAELQSAFDQIATDSASGSTSSNVDAIFKKLDGDSDGKITEQEMSSGLQKLADQFDSQFNQSRTSGMGCAQNQQGDADAGLTKDQLTSVSKEIGSSDSKRSELMSKIADNFDKADTNSDGKVNREEAMAFDKASKADSTGSDTSAVEGSAHVKHAHGTPPPPPPSASGDSASDSSSGSSSSKTEDSSAAVMKMVMQLMHAYGGFGQDAAQNSSGISVAV